MSSLGQPTETTWMGNPASTSEVPPSAALPRVLVLMATHNGAAWIEVQLKSIFAQTDVQLTLAIRDDASTDETVEITRSTCGERAVRLERGTVPTGSAAANFFQLFRTVDVEGHDFVALADQDDDWHPDKLARAVTSLGRSDADGYSAAVQACWPDGKTSVLRQHPKTSVADYLFEGAGQGCTFVMRAAFFRAAQHALAAQRDKLTRIHYHDWTLYALCRSSGGRWFFDPVVCMQYRQHSANDTGARSDWLAISKRLSLIRSGWYGRQVASVAQLCVSSGGLREDIWAARYLARLSEAGSLRGRLRLCGFVWRAGRRRWTDRLVLALAAVSGRLGDQSLKAIWARDRHSRQ